MKSPLTVVLLVAAALSGLAFARPVPQDTLEQRVQALEARVAESGAADVALAGEVLELKQLVEATVTYLEAQAKAAAEMEETLAASEEAGFTYGINPESRKILLAGWREKLDALQKDVPGAGAEPDVKSASTRQRRR